MPACKKVEENLRPRHTCKAKIAHPDAVSSTVLSMLRVLIVLALIFGVYQIYTKGWQGASSTPLDQDGKPAVVLVVGPGCGEHCKRVRSLLDSRGVVFEEIDVAGPDGAPVDNQYGITAYPTTLIGKVQIRGDDLARIGAVLAETYGAQMLSGAERSAMAGHFDAQGKPKVVLYGTAWCGYCKKQRELFGQKGIAFDDLDVETSSAAMSAYRGLEGRGYPLTYVGYRRFDGYQEADIMAAIDDLVKK